MAKLDWQKADQYKYTEQLDNKGWAWEFIRRSETYRAAYAKLAHEDQGQIFHQPEMKPGETEIDWRYRADEIGLEARSMNYAQYRAREWNLWDMYDPEEIYHPKKIHFDLSNPYPIFFSDLIGLPEDLSEEAAQKAHSLFSDKPMLKGLRPYDELTQSSHLMPGKNLLFVAFDPQRSIPEQLKKVGKFLEQFSKITGEFIYSGKEHKKKRLLYLRMLDAVNANAGLHKTDILKIIEPEGTPGGLAYSGSSSKTISDRASGTFEQANQMAEYGYKRFLFSVEFKD